MSREELVGAYLAGGLSRRMFIRRLVAGGVSLGAAVSYAHLLAPGRASAARPAASSAGDHYTPGAVEIKLKSKSLGKVLDQGGLRIRLSAGDTALVEVIATTREGGGTRTIAKGQVDFPQAGVRTFLLPLAARGRRVLSGADEVKVKLTATAPGLEGDMFKGTLGRKPRD